MSSLRAVTNGIGSGVTGADAALSGSATIASGSVWIGGIECIVSGSSISKTGVATGKNYIFAYLPAGNSSTANVGITSVAPTGTDVAIITDCDFGTGDDRFSNFSTSGYTGARTFGRAMNGSINVTYDNALARGGTLIFANDQKLYNGNVEGSLEYATIEPANFATIFGGVYTSGGTSGTFKLTATNTPLPFMIEFNQVTNGVTATYRLLKCYSNSLTLSMDRENYLMPSLNFVAIGNQEGNVMTIQA